MTIDGGALTAFTDHLTLSGHSTRTIDGYLRYLRRFDHEVGCLCVDRRRVAHWLANRSWSTATRKSARTAIRAWFRWAVHEQLLDVDPTDGLPSITVPRTLPRPAPDEVWGRAWSRADTWQLRMMLLLACHCGLRRAEIAAVKRADLSGATVRVAGKGGHMRQVPLSPDLQREVAAWPAGLVYLCPGRWGGHVEASYVGKRLSTLLGPGWSGHTLRHRAATNAYEASGDLGAVQDMLGHASPETTRIYTRISSERLAAAVTGGAALSPTRPTLVAA